MEQIMSIIGPIVAIIIIDLALSGDNAAVIGLAIKDLPTAQRKQAAFLGAGGAIVLRIFFTAIATVLMGLPFLNAGGGALLLWITWKLVRHKDSEEHVTSSAKFWAAVWAIIIADLSMAFDNVMAVAGAAEGHVGLVIFGLLVSIPILIWGSNWLASWMNKQPFIIYVGAAILLHTAFAMILRDKALGLEEYTRPLGEKIIPWALAVPLLVWGWFEAKKIKQARAASAEAVSAKHS